MQAHRPSVEGVGTWLFGLVVVAVALSVGLSFAMNAAATDVRAQVSVASGTGPEDPRSVWSTWLAVQFTTDLPPDDYALLAARATELDHRADRIRELAAAAALGGLIVMLLTARPDTARADKNPLASTSNNGTV